MAPTVSLCMIVRDEERWVGTCIASVRDFVNEVVVVDTGSTDTTREVARAAGATVYDFVWCDDFSAARNFASAQATSDWLLFLDADEILDDEGIALLRDWLRAPTADCMNLIQTTYSFESQMIMWKPNRLACPAAHSFPGYIESTLIRLFRRDDNLFFAGRIHEEVVAKHVRPVANVGVRIHHYGQVRRDPHLDKNEVYLRIGRKKMDESPQDPKAAYEFGVASWGVGNDADAAFGFERALEILPHHVSSLCALALLRRRAQRIDDALHLYQRALEIQPAHIGSLVGLSDLLAEMGRAIEAGVLLERAHEVDAEHPQVLMKLGSLYADAGMGALGLSFMAKACSVMPNDATVHFNRACLLLQLRRESEAEGAFAQLFRMVPDDADLRNKVCALYQSHAIHCPSAFLPPASAEVSQL